MTITVAQREHLQSLARNIAEAHAICRQIPPIDNSQSVRQQVETTAQQLVAHAEADIAQRRFDAAVDVIAGG